MRIILMILGLLILLVLTFFTWIVFFMPRPDFEAMSKPAPELESARLLVGEGRFTKATFFSDPALGVINEIVAAKAGTPEELILVGDQGANFVGPGGLSTRSVKFAGALGDVTVVRSSSGPAGFLHWGTWSHSLSFTNLSAEKTWSYRSWLGINDAAAGDVDGDGSPEVVVGMNANGGIALLNLEGKELWRNREDGNIWKVAIVPAEPNRPGEIIHSEAGGDLVARDHRGRQLRRYDLPIYFSDFALIPSAGTDRDWVTLTSRGKPFYLFGLDGKAIAELPVAEGLPADTGTKGEIRGTPLVINGTGGYAVLQQYPIWNRSVLHIYRAEGLLYAEVLTDSCKALFAPQTTPESQLLVGCNGKVLSYAPVPAKQPAHKRRSN